MTPEKGPKSFGAFEERASVFNPKTVSNPKWRRWTKVTCFPGGGGGGGGRWYCQIWTIYVCAAVNGMVFNQFTLGLGI